MKTSTKLRTESTVSKSRPNAATSAPMESEFGSKNRTPRTRPRRPPPYLRLVEEAAALEQACPLLGGDLDVSRREQEDFVRDALHAPVQGVREPAREVDQPLRELLVGALEVEDNRDPVLELVRDLLGVVEASRQDEVDADGAWAAVDAAQPGCGTQDGGAVVRLGVGIGPVVEIAPAARCEPAHVRPLGVGPLELLVREVALLVPLLVLFGDPEVDEGPVPDVGKAHRSAEFYSQRG